MRVSDLFPGMALIPATAAAVAIGLSPKTLRNRFYQGRDDIGIINLCGRLVVPAESLDAWLLKQYEACGLAHLATGEAVPVLPPAVVGKRGRGRPRKIPGGGAK